MGGSERIFRGWRQLFNAIAAPSTDALKRSSWHRIRVTRSARSAGLRWSRGKKAPTFPHTSLLNVHRQKAGMTSHPKRPRDPNQLAKSIIDIATAQKPDRDPTPEEQGKDPAAAVLEGREGAGRWPLTKRFLSGSFFKLTHYLLLDSPNK
jgi:hypothetical protein